MQSSAVIIAVFEFILLLFSLSVHESAHAWTASRLGDQTARMLGRVSLNPMVHVDPIGTLLLPALMIFGPLFGINFFGGFLFGWAKPVPIISRNFRNFKRDDMLVSLAGPASNLLLACIAVLVLAIDIIAIPNARVMVLTTFKLFLMTGMISTSQPFLLLCFLAILLNLTLCIFNLLPIPPLDGSHVLRNILPYGAVRVFDSISGPLSYVLLIVVGRVVLGMLLFPVLGLVYAVLAHI
ncbi:MAG: site-2 protease family protein [Terracidiphilus sp.]